MEGRKSQGAPVTQLEQQNVQPAPISPSQNKVPAAEMPASAPIPVPSQPVVRTTPASTLEPRQAPAPTLAKPEPVVAISPSLNSSSVSAARDPGIVNATDAGPQLKILELPWREVDVAGASNSGGNQ